MRPVTVWNLSRRCNLNCIQCIADSRDFDFAGELTTEEGRKLIDDLADFQVPVLLFSGGEPLLREDLFELIEHARSRGIRPVLSTNGTLIDEEIARRLRDSGVAYVEVGLGAVGGVNDRLRGRKGAFEAALAGLRACLAAGLDAGLRITLTKHAVEHLDAIFDLIERERIPRASFQHPVDNGRGRRPAQEGVTRAEMRAALDRIIGNAMRLRERGCPAEIVTEGNFADGVYLYLRLLRESAGRAPEALEILRRCGGDASGAGIAHIDNLGFVHADRFWCAHSFGNVRDRKFGDIWTDPSDPLLAGLKDRRPLLKGRCGACRWQELCNGNPRVRALAVHGDPWQEDPACYLTDEEIGLAPANAGAPFASSEER